MIARCLAVVATAALAASSYATIPYGSAGGPFPGFGPAVSPPPIVGGKEYSHDFDHEVVPGAVGPPNVLLDAQQIVAWDGVGGVTNVTDYTGTRTTYTLEDDIDAIANQGDFAYEELKADIAHLVFSVDDAYTLYSFGAPSPGFLPATGPVTLANGNVIGGAGEYSVEESTFFGNPADFQTVWAVQADVNGMAAPDGPDDLDGVEVWGPEPPLADANKYSLDADIFNFGSTIAGDAVSVWNASGSPYVAHSAIVAAVTSLLPGDPPSSFPIEEAINLDALMVQDVIGSPDEFERDPAGPGFGDEIIFSIRQIPNPADPDGYYATGSEIFVLNAGGFATYLTHGGHVWDHAYSLATFDIWSMDNQNYGVIDINAIEAIGEFAVPEPTAAALLLAAVAAATQRHRVRTT